VLLVLAAAGCGKTAPIARTGTQIMADTLRVLTEQALADPMRFPYLNRRRAEVLDRAIAQGRRPATPSNRLQVAQERLRAGQTREAIRDLEGMLQAAGLPPDGSRIPLEAKPLFDLLALSWLRLGEQENCIDNPAAEVCILPLAGKGRHGQAEGARQAIALFQQILKAFPHDYGSRWLLNLAAMAVGDFPDRVPAGGLIPALQPPARPAFPRYRNIAGDLGLGLSSHAGGLAVEDFNRDGLLDLFMTRMGLDDQARLFLADGTGGFVERTREAGLEGITGGLNLIHADYDNDGNDDILILRGAWMREAGAFPRSLLRNRGDGTFEDVTFQAGLTSFQPSQTAAWADFNLDGCLDLFIGNESLRTLESRPEPVPHRSELYLNNCDGTFREVSHQVGIDVEEFVKGVVWGDIDNDGLPDLFISVMGGPNRLYHNRGGSSRAAWRFDEVARTAGVERPIFSFPAWFFDYDNDGWEDLLVLSYDLRHVNELPEAAAREYLGLPLRIAHGTDTVPIETPRLFHNNRDGTFRDVTRPAGLDRPLWAMGSNFGDLDNDGWLDFYVGTGSPDLSAVVPNRMFRNRGGRGFDDVTLAGGFGHIQKGHAAAFADFTRSGQEDVFMVMGGAYEGDRFANLLFENPGWTGRHWVTLELAGTTANRSAIGARVELLTRQADGSARRLYRTVSTGGSFGAGSLQLHVGLDRATRLERVTIQWPDSARTRTSYPDLALDRFYRIVQGAAPVALDRPPVPYRKTAPTP
jgi:hypothetical protein